jgi:hypothetical protein
VPFVGHSAKALPMAHSALGKEKALEPETAALPSANLAGTRQRVFIFFFWKFFAECQTEDITYISHPSKHISHICHIHHIYHIYHNKFSHHPIKSITVVQISQAHHNNYITNPSASPSEP